MVQINRHRPSKYFSIKRYRCEFLALARAKRFERALKYLAAKCRQQRRVLEGASGIYQYDRTDNKNNKSYTYETVQAVWIEDGTKRSTSFHTSKHGVDGAMALARSCVNRSEKIPDSSREICVSRNKCISRDKCIYKSTE